MKTILKGASILMAIFMFSMVLTPVIATEPLPFDRTGTADVTNTYISSWINGVEYGNDTSTAAGLYQVDTVGDDTGIIDNTRTGGIAGDTIQYAAPIITTIISTLNMLPPQVRTNYAPACIASGTGDHKLRQSIKYKQTSFYSRFYA